MKELALSLGYQEKDLVGLTDAQIKAKCDEAIAALKDPAKQIAALAKDGYSITAKAKKAEDDEDDDEAGAGETKPAKTKAAASDEDGFVSKKAHNKLQDCHDKLEAKHNKLADKCAKMEDRLKDCESKMKASTDGEISAKVETKITALVTAGKLADNDETKAIVRKNLTNDFDAFAPIYDAIPGKAIAAKVPGVNTILDMAAKTKEEKADKPAFKKSAILEAMAESESNGKATEKAIK